MNSDCIMNRVKRILEDPDSDNVVDVKVHLFVSIDEEPPVVFARGVQLSAPHLRAVVESTLDSDRPRLYPLGWYSVLEKKIKALFQAGERRMLQDMGVYEAQEKYWDTEAQDE